MRRYSFSARDGRHKLPYFRVMAVTKRAISHVDHRAPYCALEGKPLPGKRSAVGHDLTHAMTMLLVGAPLRQVPIPRLRLR